VVFSPGFLSPFDAPPFASWVILFPPGRQLPLRSAYRHQAGPRRGFHVPHAADTTGEGALSTPGPWCPHDRQVTSGRQRRFPTAGPALRRNPHLPELRLTRCLRGFTHVHPSGLPLACSPRMGREALGLELRAPHPAVTRDARRSRDGLWALARDQTVDHSTLHSVDPLPACDLVSHWLATVAGKGAATRSAQALLTL
jgi:hypothetical protein